MRNYFAFRGLERQRELYRRTVVSYAAYLRGIERVSRRISAVLLAEIENGVERNARDFERCSVCKSAIIFLRRTVRELLQQLVERKSPFVCAAAFVGRSRAVAGKTLHPAFKLRYDIGELVYVGREREVRAVIGPNIAVGKRYVEILLIYVLVFRERYARIN